MTQSLFICILFLLFQSISGYGGDGRALTANESADEYQMSLIQEWAMAKVYL